MFQGKEKSIESKSMNLHRPIALFQGKPCDSDHFKDVFTRWHHMCSSDYERCKVERLQEDFSHLIASFKESDSLQREVLIHLMHKLASLLMDAQLHRYVSIYPAEFPNVNLTFLEKALKETSWEVAQTGAEMRIYESAVCFLWPEKQTQLNKSIFETLMGKSAFFCEHRHRISFAPNQFVSSLVRVISTYCIDEDAFWQHRILLLDAHLLSRDNLKRLDDERKDDNKKMEESFALLLRKVIFPSLNDQVSEWLQNQLHVEIGAPVRLIQHFLGTKCCDRCGDQYDTRTFLCEVCNDHTCENCTSGDGWEDRLHDEVYMCCSCYRSTCNFYEMG